MISISRLLSFNNSDGRLVILLPCGRETIIDAADADIVSAYRWYAAQQASGRHYARGERHRGDPRVYLQRLLMRPPVGVVVDHRDGFGLHNWRGNLRATTAAKNNQNVGKRSSRKPFKGVYGGNGKRFFAVIIADGVRYADYGHTSAEAAAVAYDTMAMRHHGEFARLNFPTQSTGA